MCKTFTCPAEWGSPVSCGCETPYLPTLLWKVQVRAMILSQVIDMVLPASQEKSQRPVLGGPCPRKDPPPQGTTKEGQDLQLRDWAGLLEALNHSQEQRGRDGGRGGGQTVHQSLRARVNLTR